MTLRGLGRGLGLRAPGPRPSALVAPQTFAFVFAFALALVVGSASAEHTFAHRVVLQGRLVDARGLPLPAVVVNASIEGDILVEPCTEQKDVTDANGDFWLCYHKHALLRDLRVTIRAGNATEVRPLDRELRTMTFLLVDAESRAGIAPPLWNETFRVHGRVWDRGFTTVEDVAVQGTALVNASVTVTLRGDASKGSSYDLVTDGFGDYDATLRLVNGEDPAALRLQVSSQNATLDGTLDMMHHRNVVDFRLPFGAAPTPAYSGTEPGSSTPRASPVLVLVAVGAGVVTVAWLARRR